MNGDETQSQQTGVLTFQPFDDSDTYLMSYGDDSYLAQLNELDNYGLSYRLTSFNSTPAPLVRGGQLIIKNTLNDITQIIKVTNTYRLDTSDPTLTSDVGYGWI